VRAKRVLSAILRPFTRVHPEEAATVGLMAICAFFLLTAYYLLKTVREPLILLEGGAEVKLYARAGQALLMVGVVYVYGELARRVGRTKLLSFVFLFFISNLAVFTLLATTDAPIGLAFFLWVGVFSYTVVAQLWAFAADIYSEEQGKRLFPIIGAGSSIGAVLGALFARSLVPYGPPVLMGTAVVLLLVCVAMIVWIGRRSQVQARHEESAVDKPLAEQSAWHVLAHDRYLILIAGMVVFLNWVNSTGEYLLDRTLVVAANESAAAGGVAAKTYIGAFKADYYFWYNSIGLVLELFVVSRVFKLVGVRKALLVMPFFALLAYGSAFFFPVLAVLRLVKIGENSLQYSLQDTTRHALFLVATRVEKYVGKTATDTVAVRIGAIMSTIMVFTGARLGWSTTTFLAINAALAVVWLGFVVMIGREHRLRTSDSAPSPVETPGVAFPAATPSRA
jgi:AAA family ATP:ADP antiporter